MSPLAHHYQYLHAIKKAIGDHYQQPLNRLDLATVAGVSLSKLQHDFHIYFKISMQAYQKEVRMNAAKELLIDSESSIKFIANQVGYKSVSNFSHAFKKATGSGPNEFRQHGNP